MTTSPTSHACLQREAGGRLGVGLEGEGNEVADFVDELAERVARRLLRRGAQFLCAPKRAIASVQESAHVHGAGLRGGGRRGRRGRAAEQLCERSRANASFRETLVGGP